MPPAASSSRARWRARIRARCSRSRARPSSWCPIPTRRNDRQLRPQADARDRQQELFIVVAPALAPAAPLRRRVRRGAPAARHARVRDRYRALVAEWARAGHAPGRSRRLGFACDLRIRQRNLARRPRLAGRCRSACGRARRERRNAFGLPGAAHRAAAELPPPCGGDIDPARSARRHRAHRAHLARMPRALRGERSVSLRQFFDCRCDVRAGRAAFSLVRRAARRRRAPLFRDDARAAGTRRMARRGRGRRPAAAEVRQDRLMRAAHPERPRRALLEMIAGAMAISTTSLFVEVAHVGPTVSAFYRMAFGGLMLLIGLVALGQWKRVRFSEIAWLMIPGVAFAADLMLWHRSILYVGPGLATLLGNFQVFLMALAGF